MKTKTVLITGITGFVGANMAKELLSLGAEGYNDAKITYNISKPTMIPMRLLDVSKTERMLGFRAGTSLRDSIEKTVEWYKKTYPNGYH